MVEKLFCLIPSLLVCIAHTLQVHVNNIPNTNKESMTFIHFMNSYQKKKKKRYKFMRNKYSKNIDQKKEYTLKTCGCKRTTN